MVISKLKLKNFRNLNLDLIPDPGFNLVLGENGAGKSNLLDSIYHLALAKTFKPYALKNNINFKSKAEFALIDSALLSAGQEKQLKIIFARQNEYERKRLEVNTKGTTRSRFIQHLDVVLFAPHNINLLIGSPDLRREELDDFASACDFKYAVYISEYKNVLRNRNRLLKRIAAAEAHISELVYWDEKLLQLGSYITAMRIIIINSLRPLIKERSDHYFKGELEGIELNYLCKFPSELMEFPALVSAIHKSFTAKLKAGLEKEINSKQSQYGPHKDDFEMLHQGNDLKIFGSRGQQRIATFLLKLAMWDYLTSLKDTKPLILLDDVMSELDARNRLLLEQIIAGLKTQTFITTTHKEDYSEKFRKAMKITDLS